MQPRRSITGRVFGFMVGISLLAASQTQSQTTANGPYYALPSWDQTLSAATRFIILSNFNSEAVLDRETGLVWEKSPATTTATWDSGRFACANKTVGGRKGWRLPAFAELASLIDPSQSNPALPPGHPFTNIRSTAYWSATSLASDPTFAWGVVFDVGFVNGGGKIGSNQIWCVRGGMNADAY